jgi:peptidoglycan hydrolase-like protein with peptidoglycan-binding domain
MSTNVQALADYIPAAWRAYQHLGEIRDLQARALPHIQALMAMGPQAQALYAKIFPEAQQSQQQSGQHPPKMVGISVKQLQEMLNHYGANLKVDGVYGDNTHKAIEAYQRGHGLTVDGWAGSETLNSLFGKVSADAAAHPHSMAAPAPGTPSADAAQHGAKT